MMILTNALFHVIGSVIMLFHFIQFRRSHLNLLIELVSGEDEMLNTSSYYVGFWLSQSKENASSTCIHAGVFIFHSSVFTELTEC